MLDNNKQNMRTKEEINIEKKKKKKKGKNSRFRERVLTVGK